MQGHGPKRIYTPQSIEFWFAQLEHDWERYFSAAQLAAGHRIYRDGEVRELELTHTDAIIHRRVEKHDQYTVIEWGADGALTVRSSSTDAEIARSLAVAGLHEIEELVADEASPLSETDHPFAAGHGNGNTSAGHGQSRNGQASVAPSHIAKGESGRLANGGRERIPGRVAPSNGVAIAPPRTLLLAFTTMADGLTFQAHWAGPGKKREPALGAAAHAGGNGHATSAERAKLIGLAAYARKAHFAYHAATGVYTLGNVGEIPNFLRGTLAAWKKLFTIELDADAVRLGEGTRTIEVEAVATRRAGAADGALDLRWIFKAGERLLTDAEVDALLKRGVNPAILPGTGIVSLPTEKLASLNAWRRGVAETHADGALPPYLLFSLFNDTRFKLTLSPELEAWRQRVLTPETVAATLPEILRPYQRRGVEWLHHLCDAGCHGLLADEMGLGKTLQVLSLLAARPVADRPGLIVCPASVVPVWREEIARFFPSLAVDVLKAGHDFSAPTLPSGPALWLASYAQLRKHRALLPNVEFGYAVLDEGQFIKNPDAKITQTCFAIRARHRVVLTGTPLENRQLDLWSIFRFLLPGLLGTRAAFEAALHAERGVTLTRLRAQLAPFLLRRTKNEVARELPPKVEMDLICPLTEVQRAQYAEICREGLERLGNDVGAAMREKSFGFLALLTRLRQTCCDPDMLPWLDAPLADSGKINLLVEKLTEIVGSGHKVVIFSQFVMLLDRVKAALTDKFPDLSRFELTGMTLDRQKPVAAFQQATGAAVMLVSLKAAGTGITLHAADYVFLLDPWWNPAVEAQAVDRVHRIGQKKTVFVYRMVTAGTIEERIQTLKAAKREMFDKVVGGLGGDFDLGQHFASLRELVQLTTAQVEPEPGH